MSSFFAQNDRLRISICRLFLARCRPGSILQPVIPSQLELVLDTNFPLCVGERSRGEPVLERSRGVESEEELLRGMSKDVLCWLGVMSPRGDEREWALMLRKLRDREEGEMGRAGNTDEKGKTTESPRGAEPAERGRDFDGRWLLVMFSGGMAADPFRGRTVSEEDEAWRGGFGRR